MKLTIATAQATDIKLFETHVLAVLVAPKSKNRISKRTVLSKKGISQETFVLYAGLWDSVANLLTSVKII